MRCQTLLIAENKRLFSQGGHHHGLDGVQAVFRLFKGHVARRFKNLVVDFHAINAEPLEDDIPLAEPVVKAYGSVGMKGGLA